MYQGIYTLISSSEYCLAPYQCAVPIPEGMDMITAASIRESHYRLYSSNESNEYTLSQLRHILLLTKHWSGIVT